MVGRWSSDVMTDPVPIFLEPLWFILLLAAYLIRRLC